MIYYVSANAPREGNGSKETPFRRINDAGKIAKPGDEVIVPGYTFMATALAVLAAGAIPVLAECDETCTIDVKDVEKKITQYTKAIVPVHICGFPSDMDALTDLAVKYGLIIIMLVNEET